MQPTTRQKSKDVLKGSFAPKCFASALANSELLGLTLRFHATVQAATATGVIRQQLNAREATIEQQRVSLITEQE